MFVPLRLITAAVVMVCAPRTQVDDDLRSKINQALEQARPALLTHLQRANDPSTRPGELALLLLAALHDGVSAVDETFVKATKRLARANPSETYDLALRLMVMESHPDFPGRLQMAKKDVKELLEHRHHDGCFGYTKSPGGWDLSNTQYAALGLRTAGAFGIDIERSVWSSLAKEILEQQDVYGGFNYTRRMSGFDSYASMTAAGIAVMAICRQELGKHSRFADDIDRKIERGWLWFLKNIDTIGEPKERWSFYFHYGLERAAILTDTEKVGTHDWYAKGARMFVDTQLDGGGWQSHTDGFPGSHLDRGRGDSVPTAFAILFLRRKFQKVIGPITPHIVTLAAVGPFSKPADVDACAVELVRRGMDAMPELLAALRSAIEPQRRAAATALQQIAGDSFGFDPSVDEDGNRRAVRSAELWYLRNR